MLPPPQPSPMYTACEPKPTATTITTVHLLSDKDFIIARLHRCRSNNLGRGAKLRWLLFVQVSGAGSLGDCSQMYRVTSVILISGIPSVSPKEQELDRHPFGKWPRG